MSSNSVEFIHIRLRHELDRLGLSLAEASRLIGEGNLQGLRDVCTGRKRASAELLGQLAEKAAIDVVYVLTGRLATEGQSGTIARAMTRDEQTLLDNYRQSSRDRKVLLNATCAIFAESGGTDAERGSTDDV